MSNLQNPCLFSFVARLETFGDRAGHNAESLDSEQLLQNPKGTRETIPLTHTTPLSPLAAYDEAPRKCMDPRARACVNDRATLLRLVFVPASACGPRRRVTRPGPLPLLLS